MRFPDLPKPAFLLAITLTLTALAAVLALGKGMADANGYLTRDSTSYLELAANLLAGNGLTVLGTGATPAGAMHFATWPAGYPALIALLSKVFGLSGFLASKLLNIGFLFLAVGVVARAFGRDGPILALVFLFAGTVEIFAFSWSEAPFITLMTLFAVALARVLPAGQPVRSGQALLLCVLALALFATRYIGLFALAPLGIAVALKLRDHDLPSALRLGFAAGLAGAGALAYLLYNKAASGHFTGIPRPPATETHGELLGALGIAVLREVVLPIPYWVSSDIKHNIILGLVLCFALTLTLLAFRSAPQTPEPARRALTLSFLLVAGSYLAAIIFLRWTNFFDPFGFRLLGPGSALLFISLFSGFLARYPSLRGVCFAGLVVMAGLSLAVHAMMLRSVAVPGGYAAATASRATAYAELPAGAIVLYGVRHLRYQRADVHLFNPSRHSAIGPGDEVEVLMEELDPTRPVYLELSRWALEAQDVAASDALRTLIASCDRSFYLHQILFQDGVWRCLPFARTS